MSSTELDEPLRAGRSATKRHDYLVVVEQR